MNIGYNGSSRLGDIALKEFTSKCIESLANGPKGINKCHVGTKLSFFLDSFLNNTFPFSLCTV